MELLLFSNSRADGGNYLAHAIPEMIKALNGRCRACFIPFASVIHSWDNYLDNVRSALKETGLDIVSAHQVADPLGEIARAECIIVGGGNTWQLLKECRDRAFLNTVAHRVREGALYVGWSAGANMACPTIGTTNDMPIVDPCGLSAFHLIDFQINPHYTNALPPGHQGETRDQRIAEYLVAHPDIRVFGLPEGDWLHISSTAAYLRGGKNGILFVADAEPREIAPGLLPPF